MDVQERLRTLYLATNRRTARFFLLEIDPTTVHSPAPCGDEKLASRITRETRDTDTDTGVSEARFALYRPYWD